MGAGSGQLSIPRPVPDPASARRLQENRERVAEIIKGRKQRMAARSEHMSATKPLPDPAADQKPKSPWKVIAGIVGFALAVGVGLLVAWGDNA